MPSLPIPMISALALGFLFAALVLKRDRHWLLAVLVGACALQGVVISLGQHYGVSIFMAVQPVTAMLIPPLAWIAFQVTAVRSLRGAHEVLHLGGPLLTLLCAWRLPSALDVMIPLVFLGYGAAMMLALRSGVDGMPRIRLETGDVPALVWRFIALTLIASAFIDGAIAAAFLAGLPHWQPWIVSGGSACMLLTVGVLALSQGLANDGRERTEGNGLEMPVRNVDPVADAEMVTRLERLLTEQKLYLDPDLTLGRLSRRMGVPAKQLSAAINRSTGANVSRYVNGFRVENACERLMAGEAVTNAMLSSGFNTRSNFNREFRRITGKSPVDWREAAKNN